MFPSYIQLFLHTGKAYSFPCVYTMKAYKEVELYLYLFFTSALDGGVCSFLCPSRFDPKEWREGWVGHRAAADAVEKMQHLIKKYPDR